MNIDIRKAAEEKYEYLKDNQDLYLSKTTAFVSGIESDTAKEYWKKEMYTEEEVIDLFDLFVDFTQKRINRKTNMSMTEWFNLNKKKS